MAELRLFCYSVTVKRKNDWYGYSGYVFSTDVTSAIQSIINRFKHGVIRRPFNTDILPSEEVRIKSIANVPIEEGTFL